MRQKSAVLLWGIAMLALVAPTAAQDRRTPISVGTLSAVAPAGWHGSVADDNLVFAPGKTAKPGTQDEITILVTEGGAPAGSAAQLIDQTWTAFAAGMTVHDKKAGPASKTRAGFDLQLSFGTVSAGTDTATLVIGALMRPGAQAVVVVFLKRPELFDRHAKAIAALLDSVNVKAAPSVTPAATPAAVAFPDPVAIDGMGKGVAGTWALLRTGARASAASMTGVDLSARWDVFVLLPDGRYSTRLHPDGLDGKTIAQLTAQWPAFWGTYDVSGATVTLKTSNGITSTYRRSGNVMVPIGNTSGSDLVRVDTGADLRLSGTFARYNVTAKSFGNRLPVVVFHDDGTFEDRFQGLSTVLQHEGAWKGTSARGRYRIHHNSLYLIYDDGRKHLTHIAVLPTGGTAAAPNGLYVHDWWMTRR